MSSRSNSYTKCYFFTVCIVKEPVRVVFVLNQKGAKESSCRSLWRTVRHILRRLKIFDRGRLIVDVIHNCEKLPRPARHIMRASGGAIKGIDGMHKLSSHQYLIDRMIQKFEPFFINQISFRRNEEIRNSIKFDETEKTSKFGIYLTKDFTADLINSLRIGLKSSSHDDITLFGAEINPKLQSKVTRCEQKYRGHLRICRGKLNHIQQKIAKQMCILS